MSVSHRRSAAAIVALAAMLAAACASGSAQAAPVIIGANGAPRLGAAFGTVVAIEALVASEARKGGDAQILLLRRLDGVELPQSIAIAWTYGDQFAERSQPTGLGGFVVEPGCTYRLRGYETGSWRGVVPGVHARAANGGFDDFGPSRVQAPGFHFANEFRILDGELLERGERTSLRDD